jgi:hypothetical protein
VTLSSVLPFTIYIYWLKKRNQTVPEVVLLSGLLPHCNTHRKARATKLRQSIDNAYRMSLFGLSNNREDIRAAVDRQTSSKT